MTVATPGVIHVDRLNYRQLVTYLSQHPDFPCSLHIRNHLLSPYTAHVQCPTLVGKELDEAPWQTYQQYRPGSQVVAVGRVPKYVLEARSRDAAADEEEGLWALLIIDPVYAPGWVSHKTEGTEPAHLFTNTSLTMWMSSERRHAGGVGETRDANGEEMELLRFIVEHILPTAVTDVERLATGKEVAGSIAVNIFAINDIWVRALSALAKQQHPRSRLRITRSNPCQTFVLPAVLSQELKGQAISSRWSVESIEDCDIDLVQGSNSISFPPWYVRHHIHRSVLLRDSEGEGIASEAKTYPTTQHCGAPSGWAYAHDNICIGSLHVAEPYRRLRDEQYGSVGQACVRIMAAKLVDGQRHALRMLGCDGNLPAPVLANTELTKGPALFFFTKLGFERIGITTWGEFWIDCI